MPPAALKGGSSQKGRAAPAPQAAHPCLGVPPPPLKRRVPLLEGVPPSGAASGTSSLLKGGPCRPSLETLPCVRGGASAAPRRPKPKSISA